VGRTPKTKDHLLDLLVDCAQYGASGVSSSKGGGRGREAHSHMEEEHRDWSVGGGIKQKKRRRQGKKRDKKPKARNVLGSHGKTMRRKGHPSRKQERVQGRPRTIRLRIRSILDENKPGSEAERRITAQHDWDRHRTRAGGKKLNHVREGEDSNCSKVPAVGQISP